MRAEFAPFLLDGTLAVAGLGILLAAGLVRRDAWSILGGFGLGYMVGAAAIPMVITVLLTVGVPFTLWTYMVIFLVCVASGVLGLRCRAAPPQRDREWRTASWRSWSPSMWITFAFVLLFGGLAVVGLLATVQLPLDGWDAWTIWGRKAQVLTAHNTLVNGYFTHQIYVFSHADYPLQLPIWEALHFRAQGSFDTPEILRHFWILLIAFIWGLAFLLRERVNALVWAPLLLLVAVAPGVWQQLITGYADIPVAMFGSLGALALALWLDDQRPGLLALAAVMLAAAANTKNEGLAVAVVLVLVAAVVAILYRLRVGHLLLAGGAVVLASMPWRIWVAAHGIKGDLQLPNALEPGYLFGRFGRVQPTLEALSHQLAAQGSWVYLLPLAFLVIVTCLWSGICRKVAVFYLASFVLVCVVYIWVYWSSLFEIHWYLRFSAERVVDGLVFICAVAVLHLSGILAAHLERPRRPS
jgi:hypothetical protein